MCVVCVSVHVCGVCVCVCGVCECVCGVCECVWCVSVCGVWCVCVVCECVVSVCVVCECVCVRVQTGKCWIMNHNSTLSITRVHNRNGRRKSVLRNRQN